jgi:hypothetical protein
MVSASDGASWMLLVTRERKRDDREEEKKAQREAKEREIPVGMNTIDVHGDVFVAASSAKTNRGRRGMFLGTAFSGA